MMAPNLRPGEECVVATPDVEGKVVFDWFTLSREERMPDPEDGLTVRVLFGNPLRSETLTKPEAIASEQYSKFFNVKGHFKQLSVIP